MKTFAALSLVAAAACAVDMMVENPFIHYPPVDSASNSPRMEHKQNEPSPYLDIYVPPVDLKGMTESNSSRMGHNQNEPRVKVNVWDTIKTELDELMANVMALTTQASD